MSAYEGSFRAVMKTAGLEKVAINTRLLKRLLDVEGVNTSIPAAKTLKKYREGSLHASDPQLYRRITSWARDFSPQNRGTDFPWPSDVTLRNVPESTRNKFRDMQIRRNEKLTSDVEDTLLSGQREGARKEIPRTPDTSNPMFNPDTRAYRGYQSTSGIRNNLGARGEIPEDAPRWVSAHPEIAQIYGTGGLGIKVPGRKNYIDEIDLSKVSDDRIGPWTHNVRVDTRQMTKEKASKLPSDPSASYADLPHHERVLDHGALEEATTRRYKRLPSGDWMKVMDRSS